MNCSRNSKNFKGMFFFSFKFKASVFFLNNLADFFLFCLLTMFCLYTCDQLIILIGIFFF